VLHVERLIMVTNHGIVFYFVCHSFQISRNLERYHDKFRDKHEGDKDDGRIEIIRKQLS